MQGGVETHCEELFPRIVRRGHEVIVVRRSCFVEENPPMKGYRGVTFTDLNTPRISGLEAALHTLRALFYAKSVGADILHIHAIGPSIVVPIAKLLGLKVVVTHHGPDYDRKKWGTFAKAILKMGERFAAKMADDVIVISTVIQEILKQKYNRVKRVHLIYNGVNIPERALSTDYLQQIGVEPGRYVLAVGRFVEEKNFHQLIAAFAHPAIPAGYRLVIAGDADFESDYSRTLKQQAKEANVVLTGMIKGQKLVELYSHAALFVLPSSHEGLPITLLEAMSYGRKVLVSDIPANLAVQLNDDNYFHLHDLNDLSAKIALSLSDANSDCSYTLSAYDWETIAKQTIVVYQSMSSLQ